MQLHDRLELLISALGETPLTFSEKMGIQRSSVSHLLSARNKPSIDFLEKLLAVYPTVNLAWFISGTGQMWLTHPMPESGPVLPDDAKMTGDISGTAGDTVGAQQTDKQDSVRKTAVKVLLLYADGSFEVFLP